MTQCTYWLTRSAGEGLAEITQYTLETWGERQLQIYQNRLEERLALLVEFPELGRTHPMRRKAGPCTSGRSGTSLFPRLAEGGGSRRKRSGSYTTISSISSTAFASPTKTDLEKIERPIVTCSSALAFKTGRVFW